jgi:hypothetical protein
MFALINRDEQLLLEAPFSNTPLLGKIHNPAFRTLLNVETANKKSASIHG